LRADGKPAGDNWDMVGHIMVVGKTRAGKSTTLRCIVAQAVKQGFGLVLGDLDGRTFPMMADNPALCRPLVEDVNGFRAALREAVGEIERRKGLYKAAPEYPDNLDEYNGLAVEPLPRLLIVLDEFNSAVAQDGGANSELANLASIVAWRGLKFGIHLVLAAQDFSKELVGRVRSQMGLVLGHHVDNADVARNIGIAAAAKIPAELRGRAVTNRWGLIQCYYVDKDALVGLIAGAQARQMSMAFAEPTSQVETSPELSDEQRLAESIRHKWQPGMSGWQVAALMGKDFAGSWYAKTKRIMEYLATTTTTTTTTTENAVLAQKQGVG
jgi:hypothetical protein